MLKRYSTEEDAVATPQFQVPTTWDVMWANVERMLHHRPTARAVDHSRDSLLLDAAVALRAGERERAERALSPLREALASDPAYLNLCGVILELEGRSRIAKRFYGMAMGVDPAFEPARRNMRRLYELNAFGRTTERVELGDVQLRGERRVPTIG